MSEDSAMHLARQLLNQIEKENSQSSFWVVSVIAKLEQFHPKLTMKELLTIVRQEMPKHWQDYQDYLKERV